jgi:hypothetical protein
MVTESGRVVNGVRVVGTGVFADGMRGVRSGEEAEEIIGDFVLEWAKRSAADNQVTGNAVEVNKGNIGSGRENFSA